MTKDIVFGAEGIVIEFHKNYHGTGSKGWCASIDGSNVATFKPTLMDALMEMVDEYREFGEEFQTLHTKKPKSIEIPGVVIAIEYQDGSHNYLTPSGSLDSNIEKALLFTKFLRARKSVESGRWNLEGQIIRIVDYQTKKTVETIDLRPIKETERYYIVVKFSENSYDIVKNIDITRIIYTIHLSEAKYFSDLGEAMEFAEKYIRLPYGNIEIRKKSDTRLAAMHSGQWNRY